MAKKVAVKNKTATFAEGELIGMIRSPNRFQKLPDGWIKDSVLGIDWGPSSEKTMTFEEAKEYCEVLKGRLPERFELITLIDDTKRNPAINPIFTDIKTDDWYWSSTPVAGYSGSAWIVFFYGGDVYYGSKNNTSYVRPVRSSQ